MLLEDGGTWIIDPGCVDAFWGKVEKTKGCWIASHSKPSKWGHVSFYPVVNGVQRTMYASRFAWFLTFGVIPKGMIVCHNCPGGDNPACVNPDHLYLGTDGDNVRDCERKGRDVHPNGSNHGRSILTEFAVAEILSLRFRMGYSVGRLSEQYGVSKSALSHIFNGRNWYHLARDYGVREQKQKQYAK